MPGSHRKRFQKLRQRRLKPKQARSLIPKHHGNSTCFSALPKSYWNTDHSMDSYCKDHEPCYAPYPFALGDNGTVIHYLFYLLISAGGCVEKCAWDQVIRAIESIQHNRTCGGLPSNMTDNELSSRLFPVASQSATDSCGAVGFFARLGMQTGNATQERCVEEALNAIFEDPGEPAWHMWAAIVLSSVFLGFSVGLCVFLFHQAKEKPTHKKLKGDWYHRVPGKDPDEEKPETEALSEPIEMMRMMESKL